jgi:hypothetical protein
LKTWFFWKADGPKTCPAVVDNLDKISPWEGLFVFMNWNFENIFFNRQQKVLF